MRLPRSRGAYLILALAALAVILLANAHLVYVASVSQPECVAHAKGDAAGRTQTTFSAAKPSC